MTSNMILGKIRFCCGYYFAIVSITMFASVGATNIVLAQDPDISEVLMELQQQLSLSDEQTQQVAGALANFAQNMEAALASHQSSGDDKGPEMLSAIKQVRDSYRDEMQDILSKDQFTAYIDMVTAVQKEMMSDVAEIRLMDMQSDLQLSDEQVAQLAPIVGAGMQGMISLLMDNVDKRMSLPRKIKLGKAAKKIQSDMDKQIMPLLTNQQQQVYQANKEARKK